MIKKSVSGNIECYGCGVCKLACQKDAIGLTYNQEGFLYPDVDGNRCIECGLCVKVCAFEDANVVNGNTKPLAVYAAYSNDPEIRYKCSSGGIGYELGRYAVRHGYHFCGVRYNVTENRAEHYVVQKEQELNESIGSKYIQSYTIPGFSKLNNDDKFIVFGSPCQIDSLRRYLKLKKIEDHFFLVDFFCHGVPSRLMWEKYVKEFGLEKAESVAWRNKKTGWHDSWNMIFSRQGQEISSLMSKGDLFYRFFLRNRCLGKACYDECKYKHLSSAADIRIGDLWGTKYQNDEDGVSGVLVFTEKGKNLINCLKDSCTLIPESVDVVTESQMKKNARRPASYRYVTKMLKTDASLSEIDKVACKREWLLDSIPSKAKYYSRRIVEKLLCR